MNKNSNFLADDEETLEKHSHTLSEHGEKMLQESIQAFENGEYSHYENLDELNQAMAEIAPET